MEKRAPRRRVLAAPAAIVFLLSACGPAGEAQESAPPADETAEATDPAVPPGERLAEGRRLTGAAVQAYRDGDLAGFEALTDSAIAFRPSHPSLVYNLGAARALAGDTAGAVERLETLAAWGLAYDPARDEDFAALAGATAFEDVRRRLVGNGEPVGAARRAFELDDPETLPEGLAYDPETGDLVLASVRHRRLLRIAPDGTTTILVDGADDGMPSPLGLAVDPGRRALWVAGTPVPESVGGTGTGDGASDAGPRAEVREYDVDTGRLRRVVALPGPSSVDTPGASPGPALGDVAVEPSGAVLVSDWRTGALFRAGPDADTLRVVLPAGTLGSPQGIVPTRDGAGAWIADYALGLVYVDLERRTARVVEAPTTLLGSDALLADGDRLVVVQNGVAPARVLRLEPAPDRSRITRADVLLAAHPDFAEPTGATWADGRLLLAANGQWAHFTGGEVRRPEELKGPVVLEVEPVP